MSDAPERIFAWRPIRDLSDDWKDGRYVLFRDKFNSDGGELWTYHLMFAGGKWRWADFSPCDCFDDIGEFLDFGGHSMPTYDVV